VTAVAVWDHEPDADELLARRVTRGWKPTPTAMREGPRVLGHAACLVGAPLMPIDEHAQEQEASSLDRLIDHEFVEYCGREGDDSVTLEQVLQATSKIPGSLAQAIIDEERADRG
jgi:hypothetical protein